jgi:biopolymer transport protein ExbD
MAGLTAARSGGVNAEPNVIPLIDILFVLLVVFVVVNLRIRRIAFVQLPDATAGPTTAVPMQIVLQLSAGGTFAINGQAVPDDRLDETLRVLYADRTAKLLFVKAADSLPYQRVIDAMDRARAAGVQVIALVPRR